MYTSIIGRGQNLTKVKNVLIRSVQYRTIKQTRVYNHEKTFTYSLDLIQYDFV